MGKRAVLLVGSPRWQRSTSYSLGKYLLEKLNGFETEIIHVHRAIRDKASTESMLNEITKADIVILSAPLYVDSLPAAVMCAMEIIASRLGQEGRKPTGKFVAIMNNGFPEASQNKTALAILEQFAEEVGFQWAGGLAMGMGPAINGMPLHEVKDRARYVISALDIAAADLSKGRTINPKAIEIMAKPLIPIDLYITIANQTWEKIAEKYGTKGQLEAKPFQK